MEIVGFNHDDLASGGKAPYTFGTKNVLEGKKPIHNSNAYIAYVDTDLYKYVDSTVYNSINSDLKEVIKPVLKSTGSVPGSSQLRTDTMKLFFFSQVELTGVVGTNPPNAAQGEGVHYARYTDDASRQKPLTNGTYGVHAYWLRSPNALDTGGSTMWGIYTWGVGYGQMISDYVEICFGFCV